MLLHSDRPRAFDWGYCLFCTLREARLSQRWLQARPALPAALVRPDWLVQGPPRALWLVWPGRLVWNARLLCCHFRLVALAGVSGGQGVRRVDVFVLLLRKR